MSAYVVTRGGTFGTVRRRYVNESGERCVVIRWGPLDWLTPVFEADVFPLGSYYESEARTEAARLLADRSRR